MSEKIVGIIGGTGLGDALCGGVGERVSVDTPFGKPSSDILLSSWSGVKVAILNRHGEGHVHSPTEVNYRANICALKSLGCRHIIASGAVGSLRERMAPRELVIVSQVIDKTYRRVGSFFEGTDIVAHVELAAPFCPLLREHLLCCGETLSTKVHDGGTYVCMEGPAFSTRAESEMHRIWGGDLIGMTAMPEAKLAREAEISYAMIALISDYDCWRPHPADLDKHELLKEIIGNLTEATANAVELIKAAVASFANVCDAHSPAHSALEMAIWSNSGKISPANAEKLGPVIEKYYKP